MGAKPGTYTVKVTFKLTGKPGSINFDIDNVVVKSQSKTMVSVVLYDYQIMIEETSGSLGRTFSFYLKNREVQR